jgi:hypothetical protein
MSRVTIALLCMIVALVTGCAPGLHDAQGHRNPARWRLYVPPGWHLLRFSYTQGGVRSTGIQLSSVKLPPPVVLPQKGTTVGISGEVLPSRGVGLVITPDRNHAMTQENAVVPPLPLPWPDASHQDGWLLGSSPAFAPVDEWLKFRLNGATYIAAVTIGSKATRATQQALVPIVRSIGSRGASS